jgi:pyruvate ferredoxin oxidoreductase delta subunit
MADQKKNWRELPIAALITEAGNSVEYQTGAWRNHKPEKCMNCLLCWLVCPDSAVVVKDGKVDSIDYAHCKGCGLCRNECPVQGKAIEMVLDSEN